MHLLNGFQLEEEEEASDVNKGEPCFCSFSSLETSLSMASLIWSKYRSVSVSGRRSGPLASCCAAHILRTACCHCGSSISPSSSITPASLTLCFFPSLTSLSARAFLSLFLSFLLSFFFSLFSLCSLCSFFFLLWSSFLLLDLLFRFLLLSLFLLFLVLVFLLG